MRKILDIFRKEPKGPMWIVAIENAAAAKATIEEQCRKHPADYLILTKTPGHRPMFLALRIEVQQMTDYLRQIVYFKYESVKNPGTPQANELLTNAVPYLVFCGMIRSSTDLFLFIASQPTCGK